MKVKGYLEGVWIVDLQDINTQILKSINELLLHGGKPTEKLMERIEILSRRLGRMAIEMKMVLVKEKENEGK